MHWTSVWKPVQRSRCHMSFVGCSSSCSPTRHFAHHLFLSCSSYTTFLTCMVAFETATRKKVCPAHDGNRRWSTMTTFTPRYFKPLSSSRQGALARSLARCHVRFRCDDDDDALLHSVWVVIIVGCFFLSPACAHVNASEEDLSHKKRKKEYRYFFLQIFNSIAWSNFRA